jgi:5-methylcytosine-specific restriction endonuclease McrA
MSRAVTLVLEGDADIVEATGATLRSETITLEAPAVIRVRRVVNPWRSKLILSRRRVLARDRHTCVYCGAAADTIDHIRPVSRGGKNEWTNLVAACRRCNCRKADRTIEEAGMHLSSSPIEPRGVAALRLGLQVEHPSWENWLTPS